MHAPCRHPGESRDPAVVWMKTLGPGFAKATIIPVARRALQPIRSVPMYDRNASGTSIDPSAFW
jgi:hypothetical protein